MFPTKRKLEAVTLELSGVESCAIVRQSDAYGVTDGRPTTSMPSAAAVSGGGGGESSYLLTATRTPPPRLEPPPPSGNGNGIGKGGGDGSRPDDDVWSALRAAHDVKGRRKVAGVRDVLEAVRALGYGARVSGEAEGGANAMEASQVR